MREFPLGISSEGKKDLAKGTPAVRKEALGSICPSRIYILGESPRGNGMVSAERKMDATYHSR